MKKSKTFKQRWTRGIVQIILAEYQSADFESFLCHGSYTFRQIWHLHADEIVKLAVAFDPEEAPLVTIDKHGLNTSLFHREEGRSFNAREKRLAFLQHEIARLTPKKRKSTK